MFGTGQISHGGSPGTCGKKKVKWKAIGQSKLDEFESMQFCLSYLR